MKVKPIAHNSRHTRRGRLVSLCGLAGLSLGLLSACTGGIGAPLPAAGDTPAVKAQAVAAPAAAVALPDFSVLVDRYGPAVVNVTVTGSRKISGAVPGFPNTDPDDPFWPFFRRFQWPKLPPSVPVHGVGSGFIVDSDGVILTNAHVVDDASEVTVKLVDKREFKAKVVGKDDQSDIAVLKINATGLPTVKLGDSSNVKVGQWVVAIGSPYGFENSVTSGIVSAKARSLPNGNYVPFLQTDVPVNPGNSGGPLFNLKGEVVGINSQIYSRSGGFQGLSFAIPINVAKRVQSQLLQTGHVTRGRLGVTIQDVSQGLANSFGLDRPKGALVSSVDPHGAAAKAGLQPGDVILELDGKNINRSTDLPVKVAEMRPGTRTTLQVWRNGATKNISVTIGKFKNENVASADHSNGDGGRLGLALRPLSPEEQRQTGVKAGLVVDQVSGAAAQAGIEAGDVILALNGTPVKSVEQLRSLVAKAGKHIALLVQHGDARIFVPIDLG